MFDDHEYWEYLVKKPGEEFVDLMGFYSIPSLIIFVPIDHVVLETDGVLN